MTNKIDNDKNQYSQTALYMRASNEIDGAECHFAKFRGEVVKKMALSKWALYKVSLVTDASFLIGQAFNDKIFPRV